MSTEHGCVDFREIFAVPSHWNDGIRSRSEWVGGCVGGGEMAVVSEDNSLFKSDGEGGEGEGQQDSGVDSGQMLKNRER